eukprot:5914343-Heterocapsa_arctica.AAC.1
MTEATTRKEWTGPGEPKQLQPPGARPGSCKEGGRKWRCTDKGSGLPDLGKGPVNALIDRWSAPK